MTPDVDQPTTANLAQLFHDEFRDSFPTVTRCALCPRKPVIHRGTALEGREAARAHRQTFHPEIRTPKRPQRMRTMGEQSRERQRDGKVTPEIAARCVELRAAGFSWANIAGRYWAELGYASKASGTVAIKRAVARAAVYERRAA